MFALLDITLSERMYVIHIIIQFVKMMHDMVH